MFFDQFNSSVIKIVTCRMNNVLFADTDWAKLYVTQGSKLFDKNTGAIQSINTFFGPNVFSLTDDAVWRRHRTLLNPAFADSCMGVVAGL